MAAKPSSKAEAWEIFDYIVEAAAPGGEHTNPWVLDPNGQPQFRPDYETLALLPVSYTHLTLPTICSV